MAVPLFIIAMAFAVYGLWMNHDGNGPKRSGMVAVAVLVFLVLGLAALPNVGMDPQVLADRMAGPAQAAQ
jgi:hypothetical protein